MTKSPWDSKREAIRGMLKNERIGVGFSQVELANALSKPQSYISKIESGERRLDFVEVAAIIDALGGSLEEFSREYQKIIKN